MSDGIRERAAQPMEVVMWDPDMAPSEPIVLATDGTKACDSAVETAASLGEIGQRDVKVVTVLEPPPIVAGEYGFIGPVES
ncbi:MAG TPA: universal stress protein, partial [Gemmatimonadaceae bacterium]|nr:universal stress protein [Gemmatimonadaceae bacterium]